MSFGRRKRVSLVLVFGALLSLPMACAKQSEGERCDLEKTGHSDCEDGLLCQEVVAEIFRCCPPDGARIGDNRCDPSRAPIEGNGGAASAGSAGRSTRAGSPAGAGESGNGGVTFESDNGGASGSAGEPGGGAPSSAGASSGGEVGAGNGSGGSSGAEALGGHGGA